MELALRASFVYWMLWLLVRGLGKRSIAEISPLQMILLVVIGDIVQQGVTQEDMSVTGAAIVVATMAAWAVVGSYLGHRSHGASVVINGSPVIVVRDGRPLEDSLEAEAITLDDVLEAAREQGIADLNQVDVAVLNPDGKLSFLTKPGGR